VRPLKLNALGAPIGVERLVKPFTWPLVVPFVLPLAGPFGEPPKEVSTVSEFKDESQTHLVARPTGRNSASWSEYRVGVNRDPQRGFYVH
jgi:hypothetical protein